MILFSKCEIFSIYIQISTPRERERERKSKSDRGRERERERETERQRERESYSIDTPKTLGHADWNPVKGSEFPGFMFRVSGAWLGLRV